jgi:dTDP-4-amino-4,6-dideoxygalactose transaminase
MSKLAIHGGTPVHARKPVVPQWPIFDDSDVEAVANVVRSGRWGGYPEPGPYASQLGSEMARIHGAKHGICCVNGTITMTVSLQAAGVGWGDEVIVPGYTFVATAWAPLSVGAIPIIVDVDPQTYCIDPAAIEAAITPRTRAIIPVHLGCCMADMDAVIGLAHRHNLIVIEDCAHAHGAKWEEQGAGSIGHFGSFSLQSSKLVTSGEGGVILTNDDAFAETCHSIIDCGRPKDAEGKNYHLGANYRLGELNCALAASQLKRLPEQLRVRGENFAYLDEALSEIEGVRPLRPYAKTTVRPQYSYIFATDPDKFGDLTNKQICTALDAEGIGCWSGYEGMHRNPMFRPTPHNSPVARTFPEYFEFDKMKLPNIERAADHEAIWLDQELFLGERSIMDDVVEAVKKIQAHADEPRESR